MSSPDESGTAFPETRPGGYGTTAGLTKREYAAIRLAAAIVANPSIPQDSITANRLAEFACDYADELLKRLDGDA